MLLEYICVGLYSLEQVKISVGSHHNRGAPSLHYRSLHYRSLALLVFPDAVHAVKTVAESADPDILVQRAPINAALIKNICACDGPLQ
jgi:hypothetical protein